MRAKVGLIAMFTMSLAVAISMAIIPPRLAPRSATITTPARSNVLSLAGVLMAQHRMDAERRENHE